MRRNLEESILYHLPFEASEEQAYLVKKISRFCMPNTSDEIFTLRGFAGTGKTSLLGALAQSLYHLKRPFFLLAPTGRAAKVLQGKTKSPTSTIHKHIYQSKVDANGFTSFLPKANSKEGALYIVDESSMIPHVVNTSEAHQNQSVLEDLIQFVFQKPNNKLILVGDTAQLPPVGMTMSMALNAKDLQQNFWRNTDSFTLKEVKRQKEQSTVLWNATLLREFMTEEEDFSTTFPKLKTNQTDFFRQEDRFELEYALEQSMDKQGLDETVIICRSNKRANQYNQRIRQHFFGREEGIERGDLIMIVKNNYFWLEQTSDAGFLANGELATVEKIYRFIDLYGFRFVELELALVDYPNMESFRTIAFVDTLTVDGAGLTYADSQKLYAELQAEFAHLKSKSARYKNIK
ncbi:MAG: ATP-dependent DNA helicase, partial [Flavobacteriales bacterium]